MITGGVLTYNQHKLNPKVNHKTIWKINAWFVEEFHGMVMEAIMPIIAYSGAYGLITMQKCVLIAI